MWWMAITEGLKVLGEDHKQAAMVYSDMTEFLKAQDTNLKAMGNAQELAGAIHRDKALTSVTINKTQRKAEADARISAAHAGVSGSAVDNVVRMTKTNAAFAQGKANLEMQMQFNQAVEDVYSAAYTYHSTKYKPPESVFGKMIKGALTVGVNPLDGEAYADSLAFMG